MGIEFHCRHLLAAKIACFSLLVCIFVLQRCPKWPQHCLCLLFEESLRLPRTFHPAQRQTRYYNSFQVSYVFADCAGTERREQLP